MPIEIREIIIRATVNEQGNTGNGGAAAASSTAPAGAGGNDTINECVEQVMQIIQDKESR